MTQTPRCHFSLAQYGRYLSENPPEIRIRSARIHFLAKPSTLMRDASVVGFIPNNAAAPLHQRIAELEARLKMLGQEP